jgi:hypothetical protein
VALSTPVFLHRPRGTEYSVTTDRFQEAKIHWPLSGNEFCKATVSCVPKPVRRVSPQRPDHQPALFGFRFYNALVHELWQSAISRRSCSLLVSNGYPNKRRLKCSNFGQVVSAVTRICRQSQSMLVSVLSSALSVRHALTRCLEANVLIAVENFSLALGAQPANWQTIHLQRRGSLILLDVKRPRSGKATSALGRSWVRSPTAAL